MKTHKTIVPDVPAGFYTKQDLKALEVHPFTDLKAWTLFLHTQGPGHHCILSTRVFHAILGDPQIVSAVEPVPNHTQLLRGYVGDLYLGSVPYRLKFPLFSDAYAAPESDERIFPLDDAGSFILIPKDRQVPLVDKT